MPENMPDKPALLTLPDEAATTRLAAAFARQMQPGDVLLLKGGLAAGKTFFVRAAMAALGVAETVSSPTYALANIYQTPAGQVVHMDAYRLESIADFDDLALEDEFLRGPAFIEWGEKLAGAFEAYVMLALSPLPEAEHARRATLSAQGRRGAALLAAALEAFTP